MRQDLVHGTCVALAPEDLPADATANRSYAVLLRGPSGAGKSDLALRLIDAGWRLVADDQTALHQAEGRLLARAPATIAGRLEVRGLGIVAVPWQPEAELCLVVDLVGAEAVARMPELRSCRLLGQDLPCLQLDPFEVSAPAKLRLAAARQAAAIMGPSRQGSEPRLVAQQGEAAKMPDKGGSAEQTARSKATARRVVLVTGISGAGRTSVLNILEDLGYEAIDNPPLDLLETIIAAESDRPIAVGVDIRTRDFSVEPFIEQLERLTGDPARRVNLLFVDCDDEVLRLRYSETRRRHPLAQGRPLADGIEAERRLVSPLRNRADLVIDTSGLKLADLMQVVTGHLGRDTDEDMAVVVTSFSFRQGLPRGADLVFDVRFLNNPYYDKDLRDLSGRDTAVAAFIAKDAGFEPFFAQLTAMLGPLLPRYRQEGKSYLTIAIGCTGGRHRSVMVAERLAAWFHQQDCRVTLLHRDLGPASHGA